MKFCTVCSSKMDDYATQCPYCGAEVGTPNGINGTPQNPQMQMNRNQYVQQPAGDDSWGQGSIFVNRNNLSDNPYVNQGVPRQNEKPASEDSEWNQGTVLAGAAVGAGKQIYGQGRDLGIEQRQINPGRGSAVEEVREYEPEKKIKTKKPKAMKSPKPPKVKKPKSESSSSVGDMIIRVLAGIIIIGCIVIGVLHGGI